MGTENAIDDSVMEGLESGLKSNEKIESPKVEAKNSAKKVRIQAPSRARPNAKKKIKETASSKKVLEPRKTISNGSTDGNSAKFPRHSVEKALRIPKAIIDQNAGKECTDADSAKFSGVSLSGPYRVELSSALKYGFLQRPRPGHISVSERGRQAIRPQEPGDELSALRGAILTAPDISAVYKHYRGENVPDGKFFEHALVDNFKIPTSKVSEFTEVFFNSLKAAQLLEQRGDKQRIIDITESSDRDGASTEKLKKITKPLKIYNNSENCFVVMPFANPVGNYYQSIYEPAIRKAGLNPIRADADIFGTGKIIDQIWNGINSAKVLVAELTGRNPNVFYELGLAHALQKPVVLVSSNGEDVPFDLKHIRVIYYDVTDPFWGTKLIDKVAENIISALKNPEEAIFQRVLEAS